MGSTGSVGVMINNAFLGSFSLGPDGRVIVAALAGNGNVQVAGGVRACTVLYGGPATTASRAAAGRTS